MRKISLKTRTDLFFWDRSARVTDRGGHLVVATPSMPDYYFGNLLVFERAPVRGDFEAWRAAFRDAFAGDPRVRHETFEWTAPGGDAGELERFVAADFELARNVTLAARAVVPPPHPNAGVTVREIREEGEWEAVLENQVACRAGGWSEDDYRDFMRRTLGDYRAMAAEGRGHWYGAFAGDRLAGDLGLFSDATVGRFQNVGTHPDFRRQGVCGTLVFEVSRRALGGRGLDTLVMVADDDYHAARIYESVGFERAELSGALCRRPPASATS